MPRSPSSWYTNAALTALIGLGAVQIYQLDKIEERLGGKSGDMGHEKKPEPVRVDKPPTDCTTLPFWTSDRAATAEPGNLLEMHATCMVSAKTVHPGGTLRRIWGVDPKGLNIYGAEGTSADVQELYRYVSNRLAYRQPDSPYTLSPELAQSITLSDDGLTYIVRLRKGVKWQAPNVDVNDARHAWLAGEHELTADDFLYLFELMQDDTVASRFAALRSDFESLESARQIDRYTFSVTFREKRHSRLNALINLEPFPRWLYANDEDGHPIEKARFGEAFAHHWYADRAIGTGPYRLTEWKPGVGLTMVKNDSYWGEPPAFDEAEFRIVQDKAAWPREFENQSLDWVFLAPAQYRTTVLEAPDKKPFGNDHVKVALNPFFSYFYVGWNMNNPRFADREVRKALSMAVDRAALLEHVYYGLGKLISGPLTHEQSCYDESVTPWPYDPALAAATLTAAGWVDTNGDGVREKTIDGKSLNLEFSLLMFGNSEDWRTIANQMLESWRKVGVRMTVEPVEWATQQDRMKHREFDAYAGSWLADWEFDPRGLFHSSLAAEPESQNYVGYRNPAFDELLGTYLADMDEEKRLGECHALHKMLHDDEPYLFMFSRTTPVLWWDWMNDIQLSPAVPTRDVRAQSFREARP